MYTDRTSTPSRFIVHALLAALVALSAARQAMAQTCSGDCNADGVVQVHELVTLVNAVLEHVDVSVCLAGDSDLDGSITVDEVVTAVDAALAGCAAAAQCSGATYTYTFTNYCGDVIYIGQNGPGASSTPPLSGNWALAAACTAANEATVCSSGNSCTVPAGETLGRCTCASDIDCSGAPCVGGLCTTVATFCMPQDWSSGVFWPRTGCTLDGTTLTCATGQCGGSPRTLTGGLLDCGSTGSGQSGPTAPAIRFEPTTTSGGSLNYDVSVINGFNVEMSVSVTGGAGCPMAGCISDLNTTCPANLVYPDPFGSGQTAGCYQPQDACNSAGAGPEVTPPPDLKCTDAITIDALGNPPGPTTLCSGAAGGPPTYLDMYEAKNTADPFGTPAGNNTQASTNSGTITAFSPADCPPGTEFTSSFVVNGCCTTSADCPTGQSCKGGQCAVLPPPGAGVCLQFVGGVLVPDYGCSASNISSACGQYAGMFSDALGYTCQAVNYSGGVAYPCVPPTFSGLGTCEPQGSEGFYASAGGGFNPSWVQAGIQAGGGTTAYYETFKSACPGSYVFQYDDKAADYGCTIGASSANGFAISFCGSAATPGGIPTGTPTPTVHIVTATPATPCGTQPTATATSAASTATATGAAATPSPTDAVPTATPTAGGGSALSWIENGGMTASVSVPLAGMSYTGSALLLNDADGRFCLSSGKQPVVSVDLGPGNQPIAGAVVTSSSQLTIANIPAATAAGTYDVLIEVFANCGDTQTTLTMEDAVTYQ
ncbi:MAG: thaumatin family protein [Candidatus Binatia bacterium]